MSATPPKGTQDLSRLAFAESEARRLRGELEDARLSQGGAAMGDAPEGFDAKRYFQLELARVEADEHSAVQRGNRLAAEVQDLRAQLAAARAETAHWKKIAGEARDEMGDFLKRHDRECVPLRADLAAARTDVSLLKSALDVLTDDCAGEMRRAEAAERERDQARAELDSSIRWHLEHSAKFRERAETAERERDALSQAMADMAHDMLALRVERERARAQLKDLTEKLLCAEGQCAAMREALGALVNGLPDGEYPGLGAARAVLREMEPKP